MDEDPDRHFDPWELHPEERPCRWCRGTGRNGPHRCPDCGGTGSLPEDDDDDENE